MRCPPPGDEQALLDAAVSVACEPLPADRVYHLLREAEDLYWNELAWEQATDEEVVAGGRLTELAFPAFLAFVDGLLPNESRAGSRPHPDVVEEILIFLSDHFLRFTTELEFARRMEPMFEAWKLSGYWEQPHPWMETTLPWETARDYIETVLGNLPPEYPVRADVRVWIFAGAAVVVLAAAVGLPPAWHAMRIRIVDALAGR